MAGSLSATSGLTKESPSTITRPARALFKTIVRLVLTALRTALQVIHVR
jgi:hypothetical protein